MKLSMRTVPLLLLTGGWPAVSAQDIPATLSIIPGGVLGFALPPLKVYDNTTFVGSAFINGGAANQSGNTITRMVLDDLTPIPGYAGSPITQITFSVANFNAAVISARPRLRLYNADGAGGAPGTLIAGFTFNPISFGASSAAFFNFVPSGFNLPAGTFWTGLTFDDNTGATGATLAQLNNLGMALAAPVAIGSSSDALFQTTSAGSFLVNNPAGSLSNFGGSPLANFIFSFTVAPVPESASVAASLLVGLVGWTIVRRRTQG